MPISVERFIQALTKTGISTPAEADTLAKGIPPEKRAGDADELARNLVRQGKLTRFQAAAIYQDKADGLVLGNYLILDKLGAGGMGQVFRARHRRMDRVVAIKVLSKKLLNSPEAVARFQREAKAAARLTHPNIVTAYDADEAGGMHFLVMEYVDGSDLSGLVKQHGPLSFSHALDFLLQAARGLEHAHGEGVVHRDIKPSNLLLDKKGALKILDMGLARMSDPLADPSAAPGADLTHSGSIMGTIDYMAPEQAMDSRQADARSDIYSLGCTLHYLLTGRPPYGGDTILKRLTAHQQAAIPLLSATRPDVPPGFDEVLGRMIAKRSATRFQTSKELVAALDSLRNQPASNRPVPIALQPIAAQPMAAAPVTAEPSGVQDLESIMLPGIEPGSRRTRKPSSKVPLVAAVVLVLLACGGVGAWIISGHKPDEVTQSEPAPTTVVPQASVEIPPMPVAESRPAAEPATESAPAPEPSAPLPEAMPAKSEPSAIVTPAAVPQVAAPAVAEVVSSAPSVASSTAPLTSPPPSDPPAPADARLPIPSVEAQRASLKLLKDVYQDDYAQAKQPEAKATLAQKLLDDSQQAKDDAAAQYMMFREARDLAVDAANPELAERAIGMLAGRYAVEPLQEFATALEEMVGKPHPVDANRSIAEAALARVEEAHAAEDFESAKRLTDAAIAAGRKAKDTNLSKRAIEAGKSVTAAKLQWDTCQKAQAALAQTPDDPLANLAVGRYLSFVQGDWDRGLAHLAKSPDGPLKELAAKSLKLPEDAAALADLGDDWFSAAEKAKGKDKADLQQGARYFYAVAEPSLSGLVKTKIEKRLKDLTSVGTILPARTPRQPQQSKAVANGLSLAGPIDCSKQAQLVTVGPTFDISKTWTLYFEFMPANLDKGWAAVFFWGDGRGSRDPIYFRQDGNEIDTGVADSNTDNTHVIHTRLQPQDVGRWIPVLLGYDASTQQIGLMMDGNLITREMCKVVPSVDRPMQTWIGGSSSNGMRFSGSVRELWLGNSGAAYAAAPRPASVVPSLKAPAAARSLVSRTGLPGPNKWKDFQLVKGEVAGNAVRLGRDASVSTTALITVPVDIAIIARTDSTNIRIWAVGESMVIWNWEKKPAELRVHWPDGNISKAKVTPLETNRWYRLRWVIEANRMSVYTDDQLVFQETRAEKAFSPSPVKVAPASGATIEVDSFVVMPLGK